MSRFPTDGHEFWSWPEVISSHPLGFNWVTGVTSDPSSPGKEPQRLPRLQQSHLSMAAVRERRMAA